MREASGVVPQIPSPPPMTFEGSGPSPPRCPGQQEGAAAGRQVLSVPVTGSVAETPRLIEGTELGLEYAPFDEDDGPVDCDCPASCYRGHRGDRSAPAAAGNGGWDGGRPSPVTSALTPPRPAPPCPPSHPGPSTGPAVPRRPLLRRRRKRKAATGEAGESRPLGLEAVGGARWGPQVPIPGRAEL